MKQSRLSLGKASLLMVGLGTGALMGIPELGRSLAPLGPIEGLVRTDAGSPLPNLELALFDGQSLALLEITRSDEQGRFAFDLEPEHYHVFASPRDNADSDLVGAWAMDRERSSNSGVELELFPGSWQRVHVVDGNGQDLAGAELRVLDSRESPPLATQRVLTDSRGEARVLLPRNAHMGVFGPAGQPVQWLTELSFGALDRAPIELHLGPGQTLTGNLQSPDGEPIEAAIISAWDSGFETWLGWTQSDADGQFALSVPSGGAHLRAVDPSGRWLPVAWPVQGEHPGSQQQNMAQGSPLAIQTDPRWDDPRARIWIWSDEGQAWGWSQETDGEGLLDAVVAPQHAIVAQPMTAAEAPSVLWAHAWKPGGLQFGPNLTD